MGNIKEKTITLDSVEMKSTQYGNKFILKHGNDKYEFYDTRKGGGDTKAYSQWKQYGFKKGDTVEVAFEENEKTFENDQKKMITYTERRIAYFPTTEEGAPKGLPPQSGTGQQVITLEGLQGQISDIKTRLKVLEDANQPDF